MASFVSKVSKYIRYRKHPHIRTHDFGVKADLVLMYRVFSEKSA